jgi:hypothetical protein
MFVKYFLVKPGTDLPIQAGETFLGANEIPVLLKNFLNARLEMRFAPSVDQALPPE